MTPELLLPCIANILAIMKNQQFVSNPTLLWPIINLLIRLVSTVAAEGAVDQMAILIVNGLSSLLSNSRNEELITCALTELMAVVLHLAFPALKEDCPTQSSQQPTSKLDPQLQVVW